MQNTVFATAIVPAPLEKVWAYVSDFSHADHQVIAVTKTEISGDTKRTVTFKNGHQVDEQLIEKMPKTKIRWSQANKKGFVPIKNTEAELSLSPLGDTTKLTFSFSYDTIMGPIGWMVNLLMARGKLTHIAESNARKIQLHFTV